MKKTFLLTSILLCFNTYAQTSFGLKAGYTLSKLKTSSEINTVDYDAHSGFHFGALVETKLKKTWALQGELLYSRLGATASYVMQYQFPNDFSYLPRFEEDVSYNTLQLPIMGKYYFNDKFVATAGVNFSFILSGTYKTDAYNSSTNEFLVSVEDNADNVKGAFITPFLGAEYQMNNHFFIDGRYYFPSNISKYDEIDSKINFLQIGIGYKFK